MGVEWTADFANNSRDQVFLVGFILQVISLSALVWNVSIVLPYWRVNRSWFWHASLLASLVMLAMPAFEIAFILARFTSHTFISFPTIATAFGDLLGRSAYSGITILRFFRLRIVAPVKRRTSARYFYLASTVIAAANIAAIASSFQLRSAESSLPPIKPGQTISRATPEIKRLREQDRLISFGAFMITTVASVATDVLFYHAIVTSRTAVQSNNASSVPKTVKWQIFRPYIPALLASILYFICLQLSFFDPMIPSIVFATITLGKLVPAIDTIIFYRFSIEQTKTLLKSLSSSNSRPRAPSGGPGRGNAPAGNVFPLFPVQQPSASARSNHATVGPVYALPEDIKQAEALSSHPTPWKPHVVEQGYGADHSPPHRPPRQVDLSINTDMQRPPLSPTYSTAPTTPAVTPRTTSFLLSPLSPRADPKSSGQQERHYRPN